MAGNLVVNTSLDVINRMVKPFTALLAFDNVELDGVWRSEEVRVRIDDHRELQLEMAVRNEGGRPRFRTTLLTAIPGQGLSAKMMVKSDQDHVICSTSHGFIPLSFDDPVNIGTIGEREVGTDIVVSFVVTLIVDTVQWHAS